MTIIIEGGLDPFVQIQPLKVKFTDTLMAEALFVSSVYDDLHSVCTLRYTLGTLTEAKDDQGNVVNHNSTPLYSDTVTMGGTDYDNWTGDNQTPFSICYNSFKISCTIIFKKWQNNLKTGWILIKMVELQILQKFLCKDIRKTVLIEMQNL